MANSYSNKFKEFTCFRLKQALGPAYARNKGAQLAKYETIVFFDADTQIKKDFIQRIYSEIKLKNIDVATCRIKMFENNLAFKLSAGMLNFFMAALKPVYTSGYGACIIASKKVHEKVGGFDETIGVCEDCNYLKKARRQYKFNFKILNPFFYTSGRRAKTDGNLLLIKYFGIHLYRLLSGKEISKNQIKYNHGDFNQ